MPARPTAAPRPPCPNPTCPAPHVVRSGSLQGRRRYHCRGCGARFGEPRGAPRYRLPTPPEEIGRALPLALRRGRLRAAGEVAGHRDEPLSHRLQLAADHAAALTAALAHDLHPPTLAIDECWSLARRRRAASPRATRPRSATAGAA